MLLPNRKTTDGEKYFFLLIPLGQTFRRAAREKKSKKSVDVYCIK
jgi:hypothetical protein